MKKEMCMRCAFWNVENPKVNILNVNKVSECRRFPPVLPIEPKTFCGIYPSNSIYPKIIGSSWCGEFKEKNPKIDRPKKLPERRIFKSYVLLHRCKS